MFVEYIMPRGPIDATTCHHGVPRLPTMIMYMEFPTALNDSICRRDDPYEASHMRNEHNAVGSLNTKCRSGPHLNTIAHRALCYRGPPLRSTHDGPHLPEIRDTPCGGTYHGRVEGHDDWRSNLIGA